MEPEHHEEAERSSDDGWIQGNQDAETDFTVIPFQTRFTRIQQVAEPGTGTMVDQ